MTRTTKKSITKTLALLLVWAVILTIAMFPVSVGAYGSSTIGPSTMYTPPAGAEPPGCLYSRAMQASNGKMYATFEQYTTGAAVFPIYESTNNGQSWTKVGDVVDTHKGVGMRWEPCLYEMPQTIGSLTAGTLLCAGLVLPYDRSFCEIDLYKSTDEGRTWTYVSTVATGGVAISDGRHDPVWEPFLMVANNKLICYYSDERDPAHNQKLVHQTTTDGVNWSSIVEDIALTDSTQRPGMPVLAKMPNGNYIMTYEIVGMGGSYYQISSNPESWNVTSTGTKFGGTGSSYCANLDGTIVLSCSANNNLYINTNNGVGGFTQISSVLPTGYSRCLLPLNNGRLFLTQAGPPNGNMHTVQYADTAIYYKFTNLANGNCIDTYNHTTSGSDVTQNSSSSSGNQHWTFINLGNGYYKIQNRSNDLYLDSMGRTGNGSICGMWTSSGSYNQQWSISRGDGYIKIINRANGLCLDTGAVTTAGASLQMWANGSSDNQKWIQTVCDGSYRIVNRNSGKALDVYQQSTSDGANVIQWPYNGGNNQKWTIVEAGGGYYRIVNVNSGKDLDVYQSSTADGGNVIQWSHNGGNNQLWQINDLGNGYYSIINKNSGKALDVYQNSTADGGNVVQWSYNSGNNQQWQIIEN